jgi:hypothetical protein
MDRTKASMVVGEKRNIFHHLCLEVEKWVVTTMQEAILNKCMTTLDDEILVESNV